MNSKMMIRSDVIQLLLSAAVKFADLLVEKAEGFRPDDKIQSL
jgi:hypothetical protein